MLLELLVVELVELLVVVVEELEESLVELRDVVPPVIRELQRHHDQVLELPDGGEVRHDEGADGGRQHPTELGEEGVMQDTANSRSRKPTTQTL